MHLTTSNLGKILNNNKANPQTCKVSNENTRINSFNSGTRIVLKMHMRIERRNSPSSGTLKANITHHIHAIRCSEGIIAIQLPWEGSVIGRFKVV